MAVSAPQFASLARNRKGTTATTVLNASINVAIKGHAASPVTPLVALTKNALLAVVLVVSVRMSVLHRM